MDIGGPSASIDYHLPSSAANPRLNDLVSFNDDIYSSDDRQAPVAAEYSHVLLFNPVGSGITTFIDLILASTSAISLRMAWHNAVLTTDNGVWASHSDIAANGISKTYQQTNGALLGTPWYVTDFISTSILLLPFAYPIRLDEGKGLVVESASVNNAIRVHFEGREVPL